MRTNSPISDPEPVTAIPVTKAPKPKPTDWEKLGKSSKYPEVNKYFESRKEFFRRYLPSGEPVENLKPEERVKQWDSAVVIIKEIEMFQKTIENYTR